MTTTPDLLFADFQVAVNGTDDIDPFDVLHAILADVMDTMRLALDDLPIMGSGVEERRRKTETMQTVEDYVTNNYGADS